MFCGAIAGPGSLSCLLTVVIERNSVVTYGKDLADTEPKHQNLNRFASKASGHVLGFNDVSLPSEFFVSSSALKILENSGLVLMQNTAQGRK